ncbi:chromate transporter-domain-containing protein [Cladorrhinum sp. PSN332]|nr:chromate transporter-domain-containing protein [Cladorrhinum sp. PSN332]
MRLLVFLGAASGLLYNALWYFPLLMLIAGVVSVKKALETETETGTQNDEEVELQEQPRAESPASHAAIARPPSVRTTDSSKTRNRLAGGLPASNRDAADASALASPSLSPRHLPSPIQTNGEGKEDERVVLESHRLPLTWKWGLFIITLFLVPFVTVMIARGVISNSLLLYRLFSNIVVAEGWVSPRDFLIGLALIQGFPGPNFNFAVYLGALTAINGGYSGVLGAFLGFLGIFTPGLVTMHGTTGVWAAIRGWRWVKSALRGVNAAAAGLIYTAVYRLWQIGWIDEGFVNGTSLANDPWWVVVTATSYVGGCWFGISPPIACLFGAVLGLVRYGVV